MLRQHLQGKIGILRVPDVGYRLEVVLVIERIGAPQFKRIETIKSHVCLAQPVGEMHDGVEYPSALLRVFFRSSPGKQRPSGTDDEDHLPARLSPLVGG